MSELNGTNFNFNVIGTSIQAKQTEPSRPVMESGSEEKISDITTNHAEIIGRSMLANDTMKNDLDALIETPEIAENSNRLFEFAYNQSLQQEIENPYEEASNFSTMQL